MVCTHADIDLSKPIVSHSWTQRGIQASRACLKDWLDASMQKTTSFSTTRRKTMSSLESLQARLHYSFKDASLLEEALTAAGAAVSSSEMDEPVSGNKRLALIGDAVLRLSVLDDWYPCGSSTGKSKTGVQSAADAMHG